MSNLEHAIENALVCIENGKSFKEFAENENSLGNLTGISATAEEIWRIAEYVKYTYCNACDVKGGLTVAKCENCYHYEACLNSLSENKGLNNTEVFVCEHYKDKSLIVELPCRVGDVVYVLYTCDLPHEIEQVIINSINIRKESTQIVFSNNSAFTVWENDWSVYKKYVFSSREEAERALEESEKNG